MTTKELKSEIHKTLDKVPETVLQDILKYLKQFEDAPIDKIQLANRLRDILTQDNRLLERLSK
jgi:uncharacterized tellurite resistance protein B-like protein